MSTPIRRYYLVVCVALAACGEASSSADIAADVVETEAEVVVPRSRWTISVVMPSGAGRQLQAAVGPGGEIGVAAYADAGVPDGACGEGEASGVRTRWALQYASLGAGNTWSTEEVAGIVHLGATRGFDLAFDGDGTPTIAALTGEPIPFYCGANDLGLYRRTGGSWQGEVIVAQSNEAATGEPASDFGSVVGLWPALAYDDTGAALVLYKDVHGGGLQGDDFRRADLEAAWQGGGGWRHLPVDWGEGAGDFNQVAFDGEGRPVVIMFHPRDELTDSKRGLWVLRSADGGATWERVRVFAGGVSERPSLAIDRDATIWVAWYDGEVGLPYVAHLADTATFAESAAWVVQDVGDRVYDEGRQPSLAVSPQGIVALAYQRCGRASDGIGDCNPARDAVVLARRDGDLWEREVVQGAGEAGDAAEDNGLCGNYIGLVFKDEAPIVFYQCQVDQGDGFMSELRAALREAL